MLSGVVAVEAIRVLTVVLILSPSPVVVSKVDDISVVLFSSRRVLSVAALDVVSEITVASLAVVSSVTVVFASAVVVWLEIWWGAHGTSGSM